MSDASTARPPGDRAGPRPFATTAPGAGREARPGPGRRLDRHGAAAPRPEPRKWSLLRPRTRSGSAPVPSRPPGFLYHAAVAHGYERVPTLYPALVGDCGIACRRSRQLDDGLGFVGPLRHVVMTAHDEPVVALWERNRMGRIGNLSCSGPREHWRRWRSGGAECSCPREYWRCCRYGWWGC